MKFNQIKTFMNQVHMKYPEPCYPIIIVKPYSSHLVVRNFIRLGAMLMEYGMWRALGSIIF